MQSNLKVSIITVSYNSVATIENVITSVLQQSYSNIEYIIIDGGSTDGTVTVINKYQNDITKVISEPDSGIYFAMNKGLEMATGEVVGILNSDDFYNDNKVVEKVVDCFVKNNCEAVYGDLAYVKQNDINEIVRYWKNSSYQVSNFLQGWMPPHPAFFIKRFCYTQYGYFNTEFKTSADYELMLRMLFRYKVSACYLPLLITKMRVGGKSNASFKNRVEANKEDRKAWKINGLTPKTFTFIRKPLSKLGQYFKKP